MRLCKICGKLNCQKHQFSIGSSWKKSIAGSSPPEIFVGKWNYPNVYAGVLAPEEYGNMAAKSSPAYWHANKLSLTQIADLRKTLIYGRTQQHIKTKQSQYIEIMQEVAMTHKSIATELTFKKPIQRHEENHPATAYISQSAQLDTIRLQENAPVQRKIEYLVNDTSAKSTEALSELYKSNIPIENIIKLFSAGLLGKKTSRKLVPTRWSVTAVDDTLSRQALKKIKNYQEISELLLFHGEYVGNHYEFLLIPDTFNFEVIEFIMASQSFCQDYESNSSRTSYAESVAGAYYANRLALVEYLERIKRQASCVVFREVRPEYTLPCGVGILREISREAFRNKPERPKDLEEAFSLMQSRMKAKTSLLREKSIVLKNMGKQRKLNQFF